MKITLDIDELLSEGRISPDEYSRLKQLAAETTASFALNLALAFGIVAVAGGTLALFQSASADIFLGLTLAGAGGFICAARVHRWALLGNILLPLGSLMGAGGIIVLTQGSAGGFVLVAGLFVLGAIAAQSGLLAALSVLALLSALGGATGYGHAVYYLCIEQPLLTVVVFSCLAAFTQVLSRFIPLPYARLATVFSRTAVVVANFGFWVGSLWGDRHFRSFNSQWFFIVSEWFFIVGWAVAIIAAGVWGARHNNRWLVNTAAAFGAVHLYTQWFEHFHAMPGSVIVAGVFTIAIAYGLITYNRRLTRPPHPELLSATGRSSTL